MSHAVTLEISRQETRDKEVRYKVTAH